MSQVDETFGVVEKPKRVPRKRVVAAVQSEVGENPVPKKRASRKKKVSEAVPVEVVLSAPRRTKAKKNETPLERKAPTPVAATIAATKSARRQIVVVTVLILLGISASATIGFTDKGSIDVSQTIATHNEKITKGEGQGEIISIQNTPQLPDGGLVGLGIGGPEASSTTSQGTNTGTSTATSSEPVGQIPMTAAEAEAAAAANSQSSTTQQSQ